MDVYQFASSLDAPCARIAKLGVLPDRLAVLAKR